MRKIIKKHKALAQISKNLALNGCTPNSRLQSGEQFENTPQNRYYLRFILIANTAIHGVLRVIQDSDYCLFFPRV